MKIRKVIEILNTIRYKQNIELYSEEKLEQVVLITGATGMIGKQIADEMYRKGANLVLFGRSREKLNDMFGSYRPDRITLVSGSAASKRDIEKLFAIIQKKQKRLDVLVNCIGTFSDVDIEKMQLDEVEAIFDVNVRSVFLTCREAVKIMKKQKSGIIINIGSRISRNSNITPGKTLYASSKFALEGFSKALSKSVYKDNIRVVCLLPATVSTFVTKDFLKYMVPERIAEIISFLVSMPDIDFDPISFKSSRQNI
jgi:short-subunit dehydrogenase